MYVMYVKHLILIQDLMFIKLIITLNTSPVRHNCLSSLFVTPNINTLFCTVRFTKRHRWKIAHRCAHIDCFVQNPQFLVEKQWSFNCGYFCISSPCSLFASLLTVIWCILCHHAAMILHADSLQLFVCASVCVCVSITARMSHFVLQSMLHSPPESWELMPTLWQCWDGGAGLSRIDVSWRRFVVAHPCTLGTIKLKIIGSESPPFIDPLEPVNSPRHKRWRIQRWREMCTHLRTQIPTKNREPWRGKKCAKEREKWREGRHTWL